jgi:adenylate kinase
MSGSPIIVLLGAPGAGKGTQAQKLANQLNLTHLSTGDVLRDAVQRETGLGKQVKEIVESGELVPDQLVSEIVRERINEIGSSQGIVLDGYPRNLPQVEFLEQVAGDQSIISVNIQVDTEQLLKRLTGRRYCQSCGKIYNIYFSPPEKEGVCNVCGSELILRKDDQEEVVGERLRVYQEHTAPVIDSYSRKGSYLQVNGSQDPERVSEDIVRRLRQELPAAGDGAQ